MRSHRMTKTQQSVLNFIVDHLEQFEYLRNRGATGKLAIDGTAAKLLYDIWRNEKNKVSSNVYKRPVTTTYEDVQLMQKQGLIIDLGTRFQVTAKGSDVIKTMILGEDRSSFDKNPKEITYAEAVAKTKTSSIKASDKHNQSLWWRQVLRIE